MMIAVGLCQCKPPESPAPLVLLPTEVRTVLFMLQTEELIVKCVGLSCALNVKTWLLLNAAGCTLADSSCMWLNTGGTVTGVRCDQQTTHQLGR
jgi:hypothetical protein